jgi:GNAT superfamily N-acetyltransferase
MPVAAEYFIGTVNGELVCHLAVSPNFQSRGYRSTRLVVMPEWQGAGVGTKFLNWVCEYHKRGNGRKGKKYPTFFHTSHPQLTGYLKNSKKWVFKSSTMYGVNKKKSAESIMKTTTGIPVGTGYGGHFRAVKGFKYIGDGKKPKDGLPD